MCTLLKKRRGYTRAEAELGQVVQAEASQLAEYIEIEVSQGDRALPGHMFGQLWDDAEEIGSVQLLVFADFSHGTGGVARDWLLTSDR